MNQKDEETLDMSQQEEKVETAEKDVPNGVISSEKTSDKSDANEENAIEEDTPSTDDYWGSKYSL